MKTRITIYRDPLNENKWIVAKDRGDASEEIVLAERNNYAEAKALAMKKAAEFNGEVVEDECVLR